jgi:hypothetical protein
LIFLELFPVFRYISGIKKMPEDAAAPGAKTTVFPSTAD